MVLKIADNCYSIVGYNDDKVERNSTYDEIKSVKNRSKPKLKIIFTIMLAITGIGSLLAAILSVHYDFFNILMRERIKMRPGLPAFEKWRDPPIPIMVKLFIFAIENPDEFLNGTDTKLKLKEIGPIMYQKNIKQNDIVFNDEDSTLSYTTTSTLKYLDELNEPGILNKSVIVLNPMLLGIASYLHDSSNFLKFGFNLLAEKDSVFLKRTIYEILWHLTSPILEDVKRVPFMLPRPNAGIFFNAFYPTSIRYNVNIGPKHGFENFFKINTLNGRPTIPVYHDNFPPHCPFSLRGSRDGTGLPPYMTKKTVLSTTSDNLCRTYPMVFSSEFKHGNLNVYEFKFDKSIYHRLNDSSKDCMKDTGGFHLPDGLIDSSKCAFGMPVALSNPHFFGFKGEWNNYLEGIKPIEDMHNSRIIVEPKTGFQMYAVARLQSNLAIPPLNGIFYSSALKKFQNMIIPTFWIEYKVQNNNKMIILTTEFLVNYLPVLQPILAVIFFTLSVFCIFKAVRLMAIIDFSRFKFRPAKAIIIYPTAKQDPEVKCLT